jgi:hypothetical protein
MPCTPAFFGGDPAPDPAFGVVKSCYKLAAPFIADEGSSVNQSQAFTYWYGSGFERALHHRGSPRIYL